MILTFAQFDLPKANICTRSVTVKTWGGDWLLHVEPSVEHVWHWISKLGLSTLRKTDSFDLPIDAVSVLISIPSLFEKRIMSPLIFQNNRWSWVKLKQQLTDTVFHNGAAMIDTVGHNDTLTDSTIVEERRQKPKNNNNKRSLLIRNWTFNYFRVAS